jgi:hypothetical protein
VTNPGHVTTREVVRLMQRILGLDRQFEFWANDDEFYRMGAQTLRSNCILEIDKLLGTGIRLRPVADALIDSLKRWQRLPALGAV